MLLDPAAWRAWIVWKAPGRADTETAVAERKKMMDVSCILRDCGEIELQGKVRYCHNELLQLTY